jgi:hypothetical protein
MTRIENPDALHWWISNAPDGATAEFHRGQIASDRLCRPEVEELAAAVSAARDAGAVAVYSVMIRPGQSIYRLRRVRPRAAKVPIFVGSGNAP